MAKQRERADNRFEQQDRGRYSPAQIAVLDNAKPPRLVREQRVPLLGQRQRTAAVETTTTSFELKLATKILERLRLRNLSGGCSLEKVVTAYGNDVAYLREQFAELEPHLKRLLGLLLQPATPTRRGVRVPVAAVQEWKAERTREILEQYEPPVPAFPRPVDVDQAAARLKRCGSEEAAAASFRGQFLNVLAPIAVELARSSVQLHLFLLDQQLGGRVSWKPARMCKAKVRTVEVAFQWFTNWSLKRVKRTIEQPVEHEVHLLEAGLHPVDDAASLAPQDVRQVIEKIPPSLRPDYAIVDGTRILHREIRDDNARRIHDEVVPIPDEVQPVPVEDPLLVFGKSVCVAVWEGGPDETGSK